MTEEQFNALVDMIRAIIQNEGYDTYVGDEIDAAHPEDRAWRLELFVTAAKS